MPRVVHFEIPADNADRAVKFYTKVFGWKIGKWGPVDYWLATTGEDNQPGIDGAITKRGNNVTHTTNTVDVPSLDEYAEKVTKNGGKVLTPKQTIPSVGYFCYCRDTEGNVFGILQRDESAK